MFVVEDAATAIRDYASQGYDLVIAHGSQYGSSLAEIAPDFPDTAFAWGTTVDTFQDQGITNVYAYEARSEQGGFVMGVMAAMLTESDVIGIIGPIETGDAKLYVDGFKAGVAYEDEDIERAGELHPVLQRCDAGRRSCRRACSRKTRTS